MDRKLQTLPLILLFLLILHLLLQILKLIQVGIPVIPILLRIHLLLLKTNRKENNKIKNQMITRTQDQEILHLHLEPQLILTSPQNNQMIIRPVTIIVIITLTTTPTTTTTTILTTIITTIPITTQIIKIKEDKQVCHLLLSI